ncbi:hypothetical protein GCM10027215_02940 [Nocardioides zeae]
MIGGPKLVQGANVTISELGPRLSRRTVSLVGAGLAAASGGALTLGAIAPAASGAMLPPAQLVAEPKLSANGWPVADATNSTYVWSRPLPGVGGAVDIAPGEVEDILRRLVLRFHYEVLELVEGDVLGWAPESELTGGSENNRMSGTAVQVLPGHYPAGVRGLMFEREMSAVRQIVDELRGVVRWGGDTPGGSLGYFEIARPPGDPQLTVLAGDIGRSNDRNARRPGSLG